MHSNNVDNRLQVLIDEGQAIRGVNDGTGHNQPAFKAWRQRAQAAIEDKLGADTRAALEFRQVKFLSSRSFVTERTPPVTSQEHQSAFDRGLDDALALLVAAKEANARTPVRGDSPLIHIEQVGNSAVASASADVHVQVTVQQLRQLVASEPGLSPEDRSGAMASLPDDPSDLTIEKVEKLLDVATKAKGLFTPLLGWLITHADQVPWSN
jgi:hypothetical protein